MVIVPSELQTMTNVCMLSAKGGSTEYMQVASDVNAHTFLNFYGNKFSLCLVFGLFGVAFAVVVFSWVM